MRNALLLTAAVLGASMAASAAVHVTVTRPTNDSQVSTPFSLTANATSSYPIVAWHVYLDSQSVYTAGRTSAISTNLSASTGTHQLVTRAWDSTGAYGDVYQQITVTNGGGGGGGGLPTPPPGAIVFNHIEDRGNWHSCNAPSCAGGSGNGVYWMAQHQSSPSRDGSSGEFYNAGVWDNALFYQKLGANNGVHNFLWDFYFYLDSASQHSTQALEFDAFQFVHGYNYMMGSQCDYGRGVWDIWDEGAGHWSPTSISCPHFTSNSWHHIQWYVTSNTSSHQYKFVTLVVDGRSYPVNITRSARYLAWGDNLGVQWQLDVNATGQGYHEWIDSATLTIW